jgi:hypothetical protein
MNLPPEGVVGKCCKIYSAIYLVKWAVDRGEKHIVETFEVLKLDSSCKRSSLNTRDLLDTDCAFKLVMI